MKTLMLSEINRLPGVAYAKEWKDRIYVTLKVRKGVNYRGDATSRVWIASDGKLNIERGKGLNSTDWLESLKAFEKSYKEATS